MPNLVVLSGSVVASVSAATANLSLNVQLRVKGSAFEVHSRV